MPSPLRNKTAKNKAQSFLSKWKIEESYASLFLGILVVGIVALIGLTFIRASKNSNKQVSSTSTTEAQDSAKKAGISEKYTVKEGDSLWTISEKVYKSGYNWVDIAKENNLGNPDVVYVGTVLNIPNVKPFVPTIAGAISGASYTVKEGDNLWEIAVRAYGDGFRYQEIAKANTLRDPSLIYPGAVLRIPR